MRMSIAAELGQRPRHHRLDLVLPGDVGNDGERLDAERPGLARDRVGLGLVGAGVDDDVRAFAGQLQHRRAADVAAGPGYQGDLAFELPHAAHLPERTLHPQHALGVAVGDLRLVTWTARPSPPGGCGDQVPSLATSATADFGSTPSAPGPANDHAPGRRAQGARTYAGEARFVGMASGDHLAAGRARRQRRVEPVEARGIEKSARPHVRRWGRSGGCAWRGSLPTRSI